MGMESISTELVILHVFPDLVGGHSEGINVAVISAAVIKD
jgi:hypothetical protein